jgi:hypothetical protein
MWNQLYDFADRVGVIDAAADAVRTQPGKASARLAEVLTEVLKTAEALDAEIVRYLSLHFHGDQSIAQGRAALLGMEVGQAAIRINETRGHCHKIKHIYDAYLDKLFDKLFAKSPAERNQLRTAFDGLGTADDYMIGAMGEVSAWLEAEAGLTLDLVDTGDLAGANSRIHHARMIARPARKRLVETAARLRSLQADFIQRSTNT